MRDDDEADMRDTRRTDLLAVGDASVDYFVSVPHIARADDKAIGRLLAVSGGGMSANCSAAAAYIGACARLITAYGSDEAGGEQLRALSAAGVDTSECVRTADAQSWFCFVQLDPSGEKALVGVETDAKIPDLDAVSDDALRSARIVMPLADDLPWAIALAERARAAGAAVAVDLEPSAVDMQRADLSVLLRLANYVFANRASVELLSNGDFDACATEIQRHGAEVVVLTDGGRGARAYDASNAWSARSRVDAVVDTTGAGDALAGAFIGAWSGGADLSSALRTGVGVASLCVEHIGARTYALAVPSDTPAFDRRLQGVELTQEER